MRIVILAVALILGGCCQHRQITDCVSYERRDTLRAVLAEDLSICLDDLRIIPPDTVRPRLEAVKVRVERRRDAVVEAAACEEKTETEVSEPAHKDEKQLWIYVLVAVCGFLLGGHAARFRS